MFKPSPDAPDPPGIRVELWSNGAWRRKRYGTTIGSYDGIVGVLLDTGEYVDVPAGTLRVLCPDRRYRPEIEVRETIGSSKEAGHETE